MSELEKTTQEIEENIKMSENTDEDGFFYPENEEEFDKMLDAEWEVLGKVMKVKDFEKRTSDYTFPFPYMFGWLDEEHMCLVDSSSYIFLNVFLFFRFWIPYKAYRIKYFILVKYLHDMNQERQNELESKKKKDNTEFILIIVALTKPFLIPILSKIPGKPFVGIWFYIWFTLGAFVIWLIYKKIKARKMAKILGFTKDNYIVVRRVSKINGEVCDQSFWGFLIIKLLQIIFGIAFACGCLYMGDKGNILFLTLFGTWAFFRMSYKILHDTFGVHNKIIFVEQIKRKK